MTKDKNENLVKQYIKEFEKETGGKVVYITVSGSKLYGTDTPTSDSDYKGIFIPSVDSILKKTDLTTYSKDSNTSKIKNTEKDIDFTLHSIYQWFGLLPKSETGSIDMLYSMFSNHNIIFEDKFFTDTIKNNIDIFANKNMKSFIGYALGQAKKFGIKGARYSELKTFVEHIENLDDENKTVDEFHNLKKYLEEENFKYIKFIMADGPRTGKGENKIEYISVLGKMFSGDLTVEYFKERVNLLFNQFGNRTKIIANTEDKNDSKAISHSLRIALEVKELIETNFIKFPLKEAAHLRDIKSGNFNMGDAIQEVEDTLEEVDKLLAISKLPEEADKKPINDLLISLVKEYSENNL